MASMQSKVGKQVAGMLLWTKKINEEKPSWEKNS
jgi:hypothetical protein